jgi:acylphosphatase
VSARRFLVSGRVQGVGFRWFVTHLGAELGLRGVVRNLRDGCLEVVAAGTDSALAQLAEALADGPPAANELADHLRRRSPVGVERPALVNGQHLVAKLPCRAGGGAMSALDAPLVGGAERPREFRAHHHQAHGARQRALAAPRALRLLDRNQVAHTSSSSAAFTP